MRRAMFSVLIAGLWLLLLLPGVGYGRAVETPADTPGRVASGADVSAAEGATITVTTYADELTVNGDCSLREAIQAANTDTAVDSCPAGQGVDMILLASGVYSLALTGRSEDGNTTGDLDILSSLVISGAGVSNTTLDANQIDRALHVFTGTSVSILGVLIRNGRAADGAPDGCGDDGAGGCDGESGGGMHNSGWLTITDSTLVRNRAGDGGGVESYYGGNGGDGGGIFNRGVVSFHNSTVLNNSAGDGGSYAGYGGSGGGIANAGGELILVQSFVTNNWVGGGSHPGNPYGGFVGGGDGGGIHNTGVFSITGGRIALNGASFGGDGGGLFNSGQGLLVESELTSNRSDGGGAIANRGELLVVRTVIHGNRTYGGGTEGHGIGQPAGSGGGVENLGVLTIENSTISDNRTGDGGSGSITGGSGGDGGGIYNTGTLHLQNTTVAYNRTGVVGRYLGPYFPRSLRPDSSLSAPADSLTEWPPSDGRGGAIANEGVVSLHNTILADNTTSGSGVDCWGTFTSAGYNLIQNTVDCTLQGANTGNIVDHYAWLKPLVDNGGPTATHALYPQSPALNAGSCIDSDGAPVAVDQRGEVRPQGVACDMGAFESSLTYTPPLTMLLPLIANWTE